VANLIPEKRVVKNGILTTKHVRATARAGKSSGNVPVPTVTQQVTAPVASSIQKRWGVSVKQWNADRELEHLCIDRFNAAQTYECSDADVYNVLAAVEPRSVLPLLSVGIRTGANARKFLKQVGLTHFIRDNQRMADQVVERGYDASQFMKFVSYRGRSSHFESFMDAAEIHMDPNLRALDDHRRNRSEPLLIDLVLSHAVSLSDVQVIGSEFIRKYAMHDAAVFEHLKLLQQKKTAYSATEMKQVVEAGRKNGLTTWEALDLASAYGVGYFKTSSQGAQVLSSTTAISLVPALLGAGKSADESLAILEYRLGINAMAESDDYIELYEAGVSQEDAERGLVNELTVDQTIALAQGQVGPSLASGVL